MHERQGKHKERGPSSLLLKKHLVRDHAKGIVWKREKKDLKKRKGRERMWRGEKMLPFWERKARLKSNSATLGEGKQKRSFGGSIRLW